MRPTSLAPGEVLDVVVPVDGARLAGDLSIPDQAIGVVLFAHGSGSSRHSPRNRFVARVLQEAQLATLLIDRDPQGSSTRWLRKRKVPQAAINGIATFERDSRTTMSWQMRVPEGTQKIIVDSPAAVEMARAVRSALDAEGIEVRAPW